MLEAAGSRTGTHAGRAAPATGRRVLDARGAEARIDALVKLKMLFDSGVLTDRQFADERERLLGG